MPPGVLNLLQTLLCVFVFILGDIYCHSHTLKDADPNRTAHLSLAAMCCCAAAGTDAIRCIPASSLKFTQLQEINNLRMGCHRLSRECVSDSQSKCAICKCKMPSELCCRFFNLSTLPCVRK